MELNLDETMALSSRRMQQVNLRLPEPVIAFYKRYPNPSEAMRRVLTQCVYEALEENDNEQE